MGKLEIKAENLAQRCEICHQSDCYYPKYDICTRCYKVSFGKYTFIKITEKLLGTSKSIYTAKGALLITLIFTVVMGRIVFSGNAMQCGCYDSSNPYDIEKLPAIVWPLTLSFPTSSSCGLLFWLIGFSIRKVEVSVFKEIFILLTILIVGSLASGILGIFFGCNCGDGANVPEEITLGLFRGVVFGFILWSISFLSRRKKRQP